MFPGGRLSGEVVDPPPADWSFLTASFVDLEVRPENPYSVTVNYQVQDGKLYIDPAPDRKWARYLQQDDRVRARFDGRVYPLRAVLVSEPGQAFLDLDPERSIYRLQARYAPGP